MRISNPFFATVIFVCISTVGALPTADPSPATDGRTYGFCNGAGGGCILSNPEIPYHCDYGRCSELGSTCSFDDTVYETYCE
jgi:hypothetical protein